MHLQILSWQGTRLYILHVMLALSHIFTHLHHTTHWDLWPASPRVNSLWPSDALWWQGSGSTLIQVMACCLMAPSHYLSQCWLIINEVMWYSHGGIFTGNAPDINHKNVLQNYTIEIISMSPYFSGSSELKDNLCWLWSIECESHYRCYTYFLPVSLIAILPTSDNIYELLICCD